MRLGREVRELAGERLRGASCKGLPFYQRRSKGCSGGLGGKEAQEIGTGTLWWLSKEQMGEGGSPEPSRLDEQSRIQVVAVKEGGVLTQGTL